MSKIVTNLINKLKIGKKYKKTSNILQIAIDLWEKAFLSLY
jgi:hypothetical protein